MNQTKQTPFMRDVQNVVQWLQDPRTPDMLRRMRETGLVVGKTIKVRCNPHRRGQGRDG